MLPADMEDLRRHLELALDEPRRQVLCEMKGLTAIQKKDRIQSLGLGTRLAFEGLGLIFMEDVGEPTFKVGLMPRLEIAIEILTE